MRRKELRYRNIVRELTKDEHESTILGLGDFEVLITCLPEKETLIGVYYKKSTCILNIYNDEIAFDIDYFHPGYTIELLRKFYRIANETIRNKIQG